MPRVVSCSICHVLERMPDPPADAPLVPARWAWDVGSGQTEEHIFKDDEGADIMVPAYDPLMDDFVVRHTHDRPDTEVIDYIRSFSVSQETWERVDVVTAVKEELSKATGEQFAESEHYKEGALQCYNAHGNPDMKQRCPDLFTDEKRIGRSTGVPKKHQMYLCHMCLTGDTEVVTRQGLRTLRELAAEGHAELMRPPTHGKWAGWEDVPVRSYGEAPVYALHLSRGRESKVVRATGNHRWSVGGKFVETLDLSSGMVLDSSYAYPFSLGNEPRLSPQGVQHGLVYGDGHRGTGNRPAVLRLFGEDKALLMKWFPSNYVATVQLGDEYTEATALEVRDLPRSYKNAPDLSESRSYLMGFLAGYFAADGAVSEGGQAVLESADIDALQTVRGICHILGVGVGSIRTRLRVGIRSEEPTALHRITIRAADLPDSFWLKESHAARRGGRGSKARPDWKVVSVSSQPVAHEEVFCAEVPEVERFVLSGNLVTGNCPYVQSYLAQHLRDRAKLYDPAAVSKMMQVQRRRRTKKR